MQPIGILGGTFDPIHKGHLAIAKQALQLGLQSVYFVPLNIPPHRGKPVATAQDRQQMLSLVINEIDDFYIDCRELDREEVSYSIDTIKSFREEYPNIPLCMIVGRDAYNEIDKWREWHLLLDYTHIIVADRPEILHTVNADLEDWTQKHVVENFETLKQKVCGNVFFMPTNLTNVSSSNIRLAIKKSEPLNNYLFPSTINYINEQHLYQEHND